MNERDRWIWDLGARWHDEGGNACVRTNRNNPQAAERTWPACLFFAESDMAQIEAVRRSTH